MAETGNKNKTLLNVICDVLNLPTTVRSVQLECTVGEHPILKVDMYVRGDLHNPLERELKTYHLVDDAGLVEHFEKRLDQ